MEETTKDFDCGQDWCAVYVKRSNTEKGCINCNQNPKWLQQLPNPIGMDDDKFWMIYGGGGDGAKVKHSSFDKAEREATRLATLSQGRVYAILEVKKFVVCSGIVGRSFK